MIKKLLIFLIVFLIVVFVFNSSFATYYDDLQNYKTDPVQYLQLWQENISSSALSTLLNKMGTTNVDELEGTIKSLVTDLVSTNMYPYFAYQNSRYYVFIYNSNSLLTSSSSEGTVDISFNRTGFVSVPTVLHSGLSGLKCFSFGSFGTVTTESVSTSIPDSLLFYQSTALTNFRNTLNNTSTEAIANAINENNKIQEETNEKLQEQNDFISEDINEDEIDSSLPSVDSSTDITSSGVDSIFNAISNGINNTNPIEFEILGKQVSISSTSLSSVFPSALVSILNLFWWFFISYRIFKDIINIFEKVTTGDIEKVDTTNVKADLF